MFAFAHDNEFDESGRMAPGTWRRSSRRRDGERVVVVCCPHCGTEADLDHSIGADGAVSPSLECPTTGCDFHDWGRLDGWAFDQVDDDEGNEGGIAS